MKHICNMLIFIFTLIPYTPVPTQTDVSIQKTLNYIQP